MAFGSRTSIIICNCVVGTTGNLRIGCGSGSITTGDSNTTIGVGAGASISSGFLNTLIGYNAGGRIDCGQYNTAIGAFAGCTINTGAANVAVGYMAVGGNVLAATSPGYNTGIGFHALLNVCASGACMNTAVGALAGNQITTGAHNTLLGYCAGCGLTTGSQNTIIGMWCPKSFVSGVAELLISWGCTATTTTPAGYIYANQTGFGLGNTAPAVSLVVTGDTVATLDVVAYYSDRRLKENIIVIDCALNKVNQLSGVRYRINDLAKSLGFENEDEHIGLLADEVEKILPEAVSLAPFDTDENKKSISGQNYLTVDYERVIPLLIEAVKELDDKLVKINKQIFDLEGII